MSEMVHEEAFLQRVGASVFGEMFHLDRDPELGIVLQHPKWSLLGYGETIRDAEQLDDEGLRFRDFVIRLLYLRKVPSARP